MSKSRTISIVLAGVLVIAGVALLYQRNGVLAWVGLLCGTALLLKICFRPSGSDLGVSLAVVIAWVIAWPGVFYYVISNWEAGEVVELKVELPSGKHTARTWIIEQPDSLSFYYDAPPEVAQALLSDASLSIVRKGAPLPFKAYTATRADDMSEDEVNQIFALMTEQYSESSAATDVFFLFLGRSRDKVAVVVSIPRQQT